MIVTVSLRVVFPGGFVGTLAHKSLEGWEESPQDILFSF